MNEPQVDTRTPCSCAKICRRLELPKEMYCRGASADVPPQVDATLESIADELREIPNTSALRRRSSINHQITRLADAISAHAKGGK